MNSKRRYYHHIWSDVSFEENLTSNYAMISYTDLGKDSEEVIFYQSMRSPDLDDLRHGEVFPVLRNSFDIEMMIEEYQGRKSDIDGFTGQEFPVDRQAYVENPYLILNLADSMQSYHGWLDDGYPYEEYTLTEIKRLLGGYK